MEDVHNQNLQPKNKSILKADYNRWLTNKYLRDETKQELRNIFNNPSAAFNSNNFSQKVAVTKKCVPWVYYRKMSGGEYAAINGKPDPFKEAFTYTNTNNYRYWMSSSVEKVQAFGNENSTDTNSIIIRMDFNVDLRHPVGFDLKAHQAPGVQSDKTAVAIHREGFAEFGTINSDAQATEIVDKDLDHNLGFTNTHTPFLVGSLKSWSRLP